MFYKFIKDKATRWMCYVEADTLEEAIEATRTEEWEREPDDEVVYHRIEMAETEKDLDEGNVTEDVDTEF